MAASHAAWRVVFQGRLTSSIEERLSAAGIVRYEKPYRSKGTEAGWARRLAHAYVRLAEILGDQIMVVETPTRLDE
jgi:hypothetical protein